MFVGLRVSEVYALMEQLANLAMKSLISEERTTLQQQLSNTSSNSGSATGDGLDGGTGSTRIRSHNYHHHQLSAGTTSNSASKARTTSSSSGILKRDLDARAMTENYKISFRLPLNELLDGSLPCTLWTPFNKQHVWGKMYLSNNYICFESRVLAQITLIIPLRDVRSVEKLDGGGGGGGGNAGHHNHHHHHHHHAWKSAIVFTLPKMNIIFAHIEDREFFLAKIVKMLARLEHQTR